MTTAAITPAVIAIGHVSFWHTPMPMNAQTMTKTQAMSPKRQAISDAMSVATNNTVSPHVNSPRPKRPHLIQLSHWVTLTKVATVIQAR